MYNQKFTDEEFIVLYNDPNYTSDYAIAKALGVSYHSVWERRVKLGLKSMTMPPRGTPEECHKHRLKNCKRYNDKNKARFKARYKRSKEHIS